MSVAIRARAAELLGTLSDPTRLQLLAHLARSGSDASSLSELAEVTGQPLVKVGEACARLAGLGVLCRVGGRFAARLEGLREMAEELDSLQPINALLAEYPNLKAIFSHGRLVSMPPPSGPAHAQLAELMARFLDLDAPVRESEINRRLAEACDDPVKVRRMLVDEGWLVRDDAGSQYQPARPR